VTPAAEQFPYLQIDPAAGAASLSPYLPLELLLGEKRVSATGLVDSGAAINVLPYDLGLRLDAIWEHQTTSVQLTGNLATSEARVLVVSAAVGKLPPVRLAFALTRTDSTPIILGQINFFLEFDVCFFRSRHQFEVKPKSGGAT
jgi:hypothetical protein